MATVYLATQQSVDREVALKIMAPQLSADPSFGDRFLREARIAAKLHHRNVVSIYDVGVHNGVHYCAMEHLPGGPVMRRGAPPLALKPSVRCVREIALALSYAHEKGFIHRDVKPDNILLREDGSCVLSDFGIARAADSGTVMTKTGAVVGTPHYMSPEQLRGRAIDGRADLYSLGVVFFQLLTGRVPYEASDSLAIGIMHMTAPLPQLPREYQSFQTVLDLMLAKEPGDRFQTGAEIDQALEKVQRQLEAGELDTPPPRLRPLETRKEPTMRAQRERSLENTGNVRTEPQLGRMDDVHQTPLRATPRPAPTVKGHGLGKWMVLLILLGGAAAAFHYQAYWLPLAQSYFAQPPPGETELGEAALAEGRLLGSSGQDAMSFFVAALMLDEDDSRARIGLRSTLDRLYAELSANSDRRRIDEVVRRLRGVPGGADLRARFEQLMVQDVPPPPEPPPPPPTTEVGAAEYAAAQRAEIAGNFEGGTGALALYVAAAQLGRENAVRDAQRIADRLAADAERAVTGGELDRAERLLLTLTTHAPSAAGVGELTQALARERLVAERRAQVPALLREAQALARRERWVEPNGASAADKYLEALKIDPANDDARLGLDAAVAEALLQVQAALNSRQIERAQRLAKRVQALAPKTAGLSDAKIRIDAAVEAAKGPTPQQKADHDRLIREGEIALSTGQLVEPPGDSAFDKFRGAMSFDRNSEDVRAGMEALAQALKNRIDEAIEAGRPTRAHGDLDALQSVDARDREIESIKRRIAKAYADLGQRQLDSGNVDNARSSLIEARKLDSAGVEVGQLRERLGM